MAAPLPMQIVASAPGRVDIAGRVDIPAFFCQFPSASLGTCNITIGLRTTIAYRNEPRDSIIVRFGCIEERGRPYLNPEESSLPYFWLAAREFRAPRGTFTVDSDIPRSSGLGGSSAFVIALLSIFAASDGEFVLTDVERAKLVAKAYSFENGTGLTSAGFQDYLASVYGGVNHWSWGVASGGNVLTAERREICSPSAAQEFSGSIALAFTGEPHASNYLHPVKAELRPKDHDEWLRVGDLCRECARLLKERRWHELASVMMVERELWVRVSGEPISARVRELLGIADALGIAARFAGVSSGGSVWAIGSPLEIAHLCGRWRLTTGTWNHAVVKTLGVDRGVKVACIRDEIFCRRSPELICR
jgi:galactokinase/mevalonate kinase-like predicted kinase